MPYLLLFLILRALPPTLPFNCLAHCRSGSYEILLSLLTGFVRMAARSDIALSLMMALSCLCLFVDANLVADSRLELRILLIFSYY